MCDLCLFACYKTRECFLPKGCWLVLTASRGSQALRFKQQEEKQIHPKRHRWVRHHLELWRFQGWCLHSQSHHPARSHAWATVGEWRWGCWFWYQPCFMLVSTARGSVALLAGLRVFSHITKPTPRLWTSADFGSRSSRTWTFLRTWALLRLGTWEAI